MLNNAPFSSVLTTYSCLRIKKKRSAYYREKIKIHLTEFDKIYFQNNSTNSSSVLYSLLFTSVNKNHRKYKSWIVVMLTIIRGTIIWTCRPYTIHIIYYIYYMYILYVLYSTYSRYRYTIDIIYYIYYMNILYSTCRYRYTIDSKNSSILGREKQIQ